MNHLKMAFGEEKVMFLEEKLDKILKQNEELMEYIQKLPQTITIQQLPPTPKESDWMTIDEVAEYTRLGKGTIREYVATNTIPFSQERKSSPLRFSRTRINAWLDAKHQKTEEEKERAAIEHMRWLEEKRNKRPANRTKPRYSDYVCP